MHMNMRFLLNLILGLGLLTTAFAAQRIVVCEEIYSET